jgi:ribosomal peptide maturation radical SAM protein 1
MANQANRILLIQMPFAVVYRPSIALSLLRAVLQQHGFACDILYLNHDFAARVGIPVYQQIAEDLPQQLQIGEMAFAPTVFPAPAGHWQGGAASYARLAPECGHLLPLLSQAAEAFIQAALQRTNWASYRLVGFSNTFQQIVPCLSLARRIKSLPGAPEVILGGANCEGEMGEALHRNFPWIDFVCQGEGEALMPALARYLFNDEGQPGDIAGLIWRDAGRTVENGPGPMLDLNSLPRPSYDDWLAQLARIDLPIPRQNLMLPVETARGCWYGAKAHCTFCGLNGSTMAFRSKSADRVIDEFADLRSYGIPSIYSVDNILDFRYYKTVLPRLAQAEHGMSIFWEIKSNLTREQLRQLSDAGVTVIQPGIESLSSAVLRLMRKGVTAVQNIRLLKWCAELRVGVLWHLLYGFPGEDPQDYDRMADLVPSLMHLPAPKYGCTLVFLERFSPMHRDPKGHGLTRVRASPGYRAVFPLPEQELNRLAFYFDADFSEPQDPNTYVMPLRRAVDLWRGVSGRAVLQFTERDDDIIVLDTRPCSTERQSVLSGLQRDVLLVCEDGVPASGLHGRIDAEPASVDLAVAELRARRWLVALDGQLLTVAVRAGVRPEGRAGAPVDRRKEQAVAAA